MDFTVDNAIMDYNRGRIVITLNAGTPYTGSVGDLINITEIVASRVIYCYKDSQGKLIIDPYFDAGKTRSQTHDPHINFPLGMGGGAG